MGYTEQDLKDVIITAVEGGIDYWSAVTEYKPDEGIASITEVNDDGNLGKSHVITLDVIRKGVKLLIQGNVQVRPDIRQSILDNDNDSESADVIVQVGLFGEILYS